MKQFSKLAPRLAMVAVLAAGIGGVAATPAAAKKDEKPADPNALKLSPDILKQAQIAQPAIQAGNVAAAEPAVAAIEAGAKTDDDKYIGAVLRLQIEAAKMKAVPAGQPVDEAPLKAPLEVLIASPKTPAAQRPQFAYQRGAIAFNANDYPGAIRYLGQAKQMGYSDPQLDLKLISARFKSGDVAGGTAELDSQIKATEASGHKADEQLYRFAVGQNIKTNKPVAIDWMRRWLAAYPTAKNWHDVLTIYGLQQGSLATLDKEQTVDLFRLMRQTRSLDQYSYEQYADRTFKAGLPDEAKAVIVEGRSTGKIPAGSPDAAAILTVANKSIQIEGPIATLDAKARTSATGALASQTADAYLGTGQYAKAIALYQLALSKGGVKTDSVNMHLGIAMAMSGDKAGAKAAFGAVTGSPNTDLAQFWLVAIDHPATA
ncbi:MAG: hypothetical protein ACRYFW_03760 [Janthinobacterium lividum]